MILMSGRQVKESLSLTLALAGLLCVFHGERTACIYHHPTSHVLSKHHHISDWLVVLFGGCSVGAPGIAVQSAADRNGLASFD
jgi:hypothetical protein